MNSGIVSESVNNKVLKYSVIFTVSFTIIALTVGFLTSSQVILFDGIFNLIGVALTYLSIVALKFIKKKDTWNYPFGKETLEPFIVITQYCIILFICASNISSAIQVILEGGRDINIASGMLYGIFATLFNFSVYFYLKWVTRNHSTAIAEVEIAQWKFSSLLGAGILLGFGGAWLLELSPVALSTAYIDPILMIIITLIFIKTAISEIRDCVRELLLATPSEDLTTLINEKIDQINRGYDFSDQVLRLGKVGGKIIIEIDYLIKKDSALDSIVMQDQVRSQITQSLKEISYEKWVNINFIGDIKWSEHLS